MKKKLAPSILSADFRKLGEEVSSAANAGAQYIHIDVMDGMFVPSISFGMPVIRSIRPVTDAVFDVHLMVQDPERYVEEFARLGADLITVHAEATKHLDRTLQQIHSLGKKTGVALNPATPLSVLDHVLYQTDMVLLMTVNPGFGGQKYIEPMTEKIRTLRERLLREGREIDIEVDGGINEQTARIVLEAGANVLVMGSAVFDGKDVAGNVRKYLKMMEE
ncbi:MAG: ribulose-phosphate 3-epimerase [Blautia sp.]|nr:ribulose-phosphate 3-epimerase [Blautia sp.]